MTSGMPHLLLPRPTAQPRRGAATGQAMTGSTSGPSGCSAPPRRDPTRSGRPPIWTPAPSGTPSTTAAPATAVVVRRRRRPVACPAELNGTDGAKVADPGGDVIEVGCHEGPADFRAERA